MGQYENRCSDRYQKYYEARLNWEAMQTARERLIEALAAMENAPSYGTRIIREVTKAIEQADNDEEVLRRELRIAEYVYFGVAER